MVGCVAPLFQTRILVFRLPHLVNGDVPADGEAEGFDGVYLFPAVSPVPDLNHRFLNYILCLRRVESDAEGQPIELILQRQDIIPETDFFHPLYSK